MSSKRRLTQLQRPLSVEERTMLVVSVMRGEQRRWQVLCSRMALHGARSASMCHVRKLPSVAMCPVDISADG